MTSKIKLGDKKPKGTSIAIINTTLLDSGRLDRDSGILIENGTIQATGTSKEIIEKNQGKLEIIDASEYVITPGLINAHSHCCLSYVKNLCHGDPDVIRNVFFATERYLTPELVEGLSLPYIMAGLRSGVTTFSDHFYYIQGTAKALEQFGVRGVLFECINDRNGPLKDKITWKDARTMIENWPFSALIKPGVGPHAMDTTTPAMIAEMAAYAKKNQLPLHFHLGQTDKEMKFTQKEFGKTPVEVAAEAGALSENTLAVHLIAHGGEDMRILKESGATVGFCPSSQIVYERLAQIETFYENQIPVALGTDCSLHDSGNLLQEVRLTALLARDRGISFKTVDQQFEWIFPQVTNNAAQVLNMPNLGQIAPGFVADLVFLKPSFANEPINNLRAEMLYGFDPQNVRHVMVDGQWVLWNQQLQIATETDARSQFLSAFNEIQSLIGH